MPKLNWEGDKANGYYTEYNDMSLYMKIRGSKYAGLVLNYDREQVGGSWFVSHDGAAVEDELIKRSGGAFEASESESQNKKVSLENLFNVTPEMEETLNKINTYQPDSNKLYCNVCKNSVEQYNNNKQLCDVCFDKYEIPVYEKACIMCRKEDIPVEKIKMTYASTGDGFLVCVDCWDEIYVATRNLPTVDCTRCNLEFRPFNHYEYYFKTCTSPKGYCASTKIIARNR